MRLARLLTGVAAGATLSLWAATPEPDAIELSPGTSRVLRFENDIGTVLVANPDTADVTQLDERSLFVLGVAPGITSLMVHDVDGGTLGAYAMRVDTAPGLAEAAVERLIGDGVRVDSIGNALLVSGSVKSPAQAELLLRTLRAMSDTPVVDALVTQTPTQVNLDVVISEVSRDVTRELGIDWSVDLNPLVDPLRTWVTGKAIRVATGAMQIAETVPRVIEEFDPATDDLLFRTEFVDLGVVNPAPRDAEGGVVLSNTATVRNSKYRLTAFIEALARGGLATVHARPTLTTVSGEPAEFYSGLEVPVPTITERGFVAVEYRQAGVNLSFTPTVLDDDQISLRVRPRIRDIASGGATIAGTIVPYINERSVSTTVELGDGESIAIAGLYRRNSTSTETGIPILKDWPVYGALFRRNAEMDRSVELIVVVTARLVAAVPGVAMTPARDPSRSAHQLDNELYY